MTDDPHAPSLSPMKLMRGPDSHVAYHSTSGAAPGVIFLGGFRSDMTGTKATTLEAACRAAGRAFVRFDYMGHGASSGNFRHGTIGRWREDAVAVLDELSDGPQILVGSSMGGWIMLLVAMARPERVAGLVGLAVAPDFTEDLMWQSFGPDIRHTLETDGVYLEPSTYDPEPTPITMALIREGRDHLLLGGTIPFDGPVRLIHGMKDPDVPWQHAIKTADALASADVRVCLVKDGDHRLSTPDDLDLIVRTVDEVCAAAG